MKRTPEPHGTKAAYMRHWRAGEEACAACKEANAKTATRKAREISLNKEQLEMDLALLAAPPIIRWRHNGKGIQIPVYVDDPHADLGWRFDPHRVEKGEPTRHEVQAGTSIEGRATS